MNQDPHQLLLDRNSLNDDLMRAVQVRHVQVPLEGATWVDESEAADAAARRLASLDFDVAPTRGLDGLSGFVLREDLVQHGGDARGVVRPLGPAVLIGADASIGEFMQALMASPGILLVIGGRKVSGLATPSDLNKHTARTYFYLLLASLETALTTQIRARFPEQEVLLPLLERKQRKKVEARFSGDTRNNVALDLVHGMDLADLLMVAAQDAGLRSKFGIDEASRWRELEDPLVGLRNSVAHPDLPFLQPGRMVADLVELEAAVRGMLSRVVS